MSHNRLHGALGYIAPKDYIEGSAKQIHDERDANWVVSQFQVGQAFQLDIPAKASA